METRSIDIELPNTIGMDDAALRQWMAIKMFQDKLVGVGGGAAIAKLSYSAFLDLLAENKIPAFEPTLETIEEDIINIRAHHSRH